MRRKTTLLSFFVGQQKSSEGGKKGYTQEKDPLLVDKATLPVGACSWSVFVVEGVIVPIILKRFIDGYMRQAEQ